MAIKLLRNSGLIKGLVYALTGVITYPGLNMVNKLQISGMQHLEGLPKRNILFVSNHQTYFADVICFIHIFCAHKWGRKNKLGIPLYLLWPFTRIKYVAAEETMRSSLLTRFFKLAGALTVKRVWNKGGTETRRGLDPSDTRKILEALDNNWVITFPQGTTKPFAPGRNGTALIIKQTNPTVIPVVINGFSTAFNKKGLSLRKKGTLLTVKFKAPLEIDISQTNDAITGQLMEAIEQNLSLKVED